MPVVRLVVEKELLDDGLPHPLVVGEAVQQQHVDVGARSPYSRTEMVTGGDTSGVTWDSTGCT